MTVKPSLGGEDTKTPEETLKHASLCCDLKRRMQVLHSLSMI